MPTVLRLRHRVYPQEVSPHVKSNATARKTPECLVRTFCTSSSWAGRAAVTPSALPHDVETAATVLSSVQLCLQHDGQYAEEGRDQGIDEQPPSGAARAVSGQVSDNAE